MDSAQWRRRWIVRRKLERWKASSIAAALRIDEREVYRWRGLYASRRPYTIHKTPKGTVEAVWDCAQRETGVHARLRVTRGTMEWEESNLSVTENLQDSVSNRTQ